LNNDDASILKILLNVFTAVKQVWPNEWENPREYILSKTLGYSGIMTSLPGMIKIGKNRKNLKTDYFFKIFKETKRLLSSKQKSLIGADFSASAAGEREFAGFIIEALEILTSNHSTI
jgi:hypothetical protein